MTKPRIAARAFGAGILLMAASLPLPASAARLENTFYAASTTLFFKVSDAALRKLLPPGWEPAAIPQMEGGNLTVTFSDILASETADGQPGGTARAVWLSVPVQKGGTGERAGMVLGGPRTLPSFPGRMGIMGSPRRISIGGASSKQTARRSANTGSSPGKTGRTSSCGWHSSMAPRNT
jgi:hypothetical protein